MDNQTGPKFRLLKSKKKPKPKWIYQAELFTKACDIAWKETKGSPGLFISQLAEYLVICEHQTKREARIQAEGLGGIYMSLKRMSPDKVHQLNKDLPQILAQVEAESRKKKLEDTNLKIIPGGRADHSKPGTLKSKFTL